MQGECLSAECLGALGFTEKRNPVKFYVLTVKALLHEQGYTIAGARKFLESGQTVIDQTVVPQKTSGCLEQIKTELLEMSALLNDKGKDKG